jgi:hypothetical protein
MGELVGGCTSLRKQGGPTMCATSFSMVAQSKNAESFGHAPHFGSLMPLVHRMYDTAGLIRSRALA